TFMKRALLGTLAAGVVPAIVPGLGLRSARAAGTLKVGVLIPLSGPAGLFGPSARDCSQLAADEINARGGILGQQIELLFGDAGAPPAVSAQTALQLWKGQGARAFIGMHDSAVREAVVGVFNGQVPYIYCSTYEGGACSKGLFLMAQTPEQQLEPVIPWLAQSKTLKRWYLIGNDYIWPRRTNAVAKTYISKIHGSVVGEEYLPFSVSNFDSNLAKIRESKADVVLVTLVGGSSVGFNRSFASFGLADQALRLGTLIDENTLAGIGAQNSKGIYSSAGYFAALHNPAADKFSAAYHKKFGAKAPLLSALSESCLEGLLLLDAFASKAGSISVDAFQKVEPGLSYDGPRGRIVMHHQHATMNDYLAVADGASYKVVHTFPDVSPGQTSCDIKA
ncbi:MAG TPA: substrate-binding domain-containing protein, partial [Nevskiaceae bacterium]